MQLFPADRLGRYCVALFVTSTMFPLIGSVYVDTTVPRWIGLADVAVAALLLAISIALAASTQPLVDDEDRLAAFRVSRSVWSVIPALLVMFFVAGSKINWTVLVIGLAWRGWLLLYMLPFLSAAGRTAPRVQAK